MEGGALFKVRSEAKERVLAAFAAIDIRKNEVGGYAYNDANTLVTEIMKGLTRVDEARDRRKATALGEKAEMASQGLESLRKLVQRQPSLSSDSSDTESAYATTNSEDGGQSRGRSKGRRRIDKKTTRKLSPSPSTSRSPTPPSLKGRSRSRR